MKALIIAEHHQQQFKAANYHTLTAAKALADTIDLLVMGEQLTAVTDVAQQVAGVNVLWVADHAAYAAQLAENCTELIVQLVNNEGYDYLLMAADTFGKDLLPRVAAMLDCTMVSDVTKIIASDIVEHRIYAGNAVVQLRMLDKIKIMTVRGSAFAAMQEKTSAKVPIHYLTEVITNTHTTLVDEALLKLSRPELTNARFIISGGRGLQSQENFKRLERIADRLGAAVGASRAAVDAGLAPNDYQVGQTGKVVAAELYLALGISGAIQHLAGMKECQTVIAVNNDPNAPIMNQADYVLVEDLFKVIAEMEAAWT